ncbi:MAG: EAL domain-containing protein [Gammaproteobacteria bacterium]|nr:EAL domain-containing protein [Gammaproteobacteria bacterium]
MSDKPKPDGASSQDKGPQQEAAYYRDLTNDLGGRLLRLRDEHTRAMAAARRSRTTTQLIRRLYRLDHVNLDMPNLARVFLETAVNALTVERAALLMHDDGEHGFHVLHAIGFEPADEGAFADIDIQPGFHCRNSSMQPDAFASAVENFSGAPYFLWTFDTGAGVALYFGNSTEDMQLRQQFQPEDAEIIDAALDVFINVAERKRVERQLVHDAFHDALTGLPNRALFVEHLDQTMRRNRRTPQHLFSVLFLDLDRFKLINDSLGHAVGDELLKDFAARLQRATRPGDVVARLGGDEFAVLADDVTGPEDAVALAERIHEALQEPFEINKQSIFTTTSIGIAKSAERYRDGDELLRDADIAMYSAKELGGAGHKMFDSDMHVVMVSRLQLETDLRNAIEKNELRVAYQPILDLQSGDVVGMEALLRWKHPLKGTIRPREFITMAEETGLIVPIGAWLFRQVLADMRHWRATLGSKADCWVSINLSDREFIQPELLQTIRDSLEEFEVPATQLEFELTERMLMHYATMQGDLLDALRELGISIAIDDFGTGYSSLSRLQRLPIDKLKIDQSFTRNVHQSDEHAELVRTIIAMAHNLGMKCVAEGIEKREQYAEMKSMGCEMGQGFLFSRPVRAERIEQLLQMG